jgi:3'-phosphoadenosine 5'-phosphosulfate (PAPS) 3'-phosphatase
MRDGADDSIGEESVAAGEKEELTDEFTWIVDPIDVRSFKLSLKDRD